MTPSTMQQAPARKSTDIIPWPAVLRDARFAQQRARVEGPFRKQAAEGTPPTVDEYKGMIDAGEKMKQILKGAAYQISAGDYMAVEKFLDAMAAESQERIDRRTAKEPAVESSKKPAAPAKGE